MTSATWAVGLTSSRCGWEEFDRNLLAWKFPLEVGEKTDYPIVSINKSIMN